MATAWRRFGVPVVANGLAIPLATLLASYPAASYSGYEAVVSDLGANGTKMVSNGTRWRASNGAATLKDLGAPVSGVANSEVIECQTLLPINAWQTNDTLRIWVTGTKSGTTDSALVTVRVGTGGTTGDTAITGLSAFAYIGAAGTAGGYIFDVKLLSATSAQKVGSNVAATGSYVQNGATAAAAATTITSAAANALYVSVGIASNGTTNTVGITGCQIQLITP